MAWLASDFLLELRRAVGIASSSSVSPEGLTDADLLPVIDREIQLSLVPVLLRAREEFLVLKSSVSITSTTTRVRVPARAIAGRMRDIRLTTTGVDVQLTRYEPKDKARLFPSPAGAGALVGYYLEGEWIVLLGTPMGVATLDIYYLARPGRLTVTAQEFRQLIGFTGSPAYTATWASAWTLGQVTINLVRGEGSGLSMLYPDVVTVGSVSGATSVGLINSPDAVVGDFLCYDNTSPVIPLPVELHSLLVSRCVVAVLRQLGKYDEAGAEEKTAMRLEESAVSLLQPRVESQSRVIVGNFHWRRRGRGRTRVL